MHVVRALHSLVLPLVQDLSIHKLFSGCNVARCALCVTGCGACHRRGLCVQLCVQLCVLNFCLEPCSDPSLAEMAAELLRTGRNTMRQALDWLKQGESCLNVQSPDERRRWGS